MAADASAVASAVDFPCDGMAAYGFAGFGEEVALGAAGGGGAGVSLLALLALPIPLPLPLGLRLRLRLRL